MGIIRKLERMQQQARPAQSAARTYAGAKASRLTSGWNAPNNSSDSELVSSLTTLRARSRQLVRDNSYAKRAKTIVVNNVVGAGIAMEPQVKNRQNNLVTAVNDSIEETWEEWTRPENCHTGGILSFADLERQAMGQIFEAGEVLVKKYRYPFGPQGFPFALELIEAERMADEFTKPPVEGVGLYRMGVERNEFGRPLAFWLRRYHPGEIRFPMGTEPNIYFRVDAADMFHLYLCDRWPQSRGVPWLHTAARRLNDMDGYTEAEIVRARGAASIMGVITTPNAVWNDQVDPEAQPQFDLEPGAVQKLAPGELFELANPSSTNPQLDPFMRVMLREIAAGTGASYESLSRDYSQSNYSSSRLSLIDDRDHWRVLQFFFLRAFRAPLHRDWIAQGALSQKLAIDLTDYALNRKKYEAVAFKPRGWSWIDPTKEVDAYIKARRAGFMSTSMIVALTGGGVDLEDVAEEIANENAMFTEKGVVVTTDPAVVLEKSETDATVTPPQATGGDPPGIDSTDDSERARRVIPMMRAT